RDEFKRNRRPSIAPETRQHTLDYLERSRAAMYRHEIGTLPQPQCRKQTGNAEHVVEVTVGQQEPVEPPESGAGPEQLTLRALPAIDQDPIAAGFHQEPGMVSLRRWDAGRGSEKSQVEHVRTVIRKYGGLLWRRRPCELYLERTFPVFPC